MLDFKKIKSIAIVGLSDNPSMTPEFVERTMKEGWKWKMVGERDGKATERAVEVITKLL